MTAERSRTVADSVSAAAGGGSAPPALRPRGRAAPAGTVSGRSAVAAIAAAGSLTAVRPDLRVEKTLLRRGSARLGAMDEVGRGALAGPVSVGVVVVTERIGRVPQGLRDSKLLSPAAREAMAGPVRRWVGEWAVGHASAAEIDAIGIIAALRRAGRRALAQLSAPVDAVLLDGSHDYLTEPAQPELFERAAEPVDPWMPSVHVKVKADLTCAAVAGASVLAKTTRDALMTGLAVSFPAYGWLENKGYGTAEHLAALDRYGPCEHHRRSWRLTGAAQSATVGRGGG